MNFRPEPQDGFSPSERDYYEMSQVFARMDYEQSVDEINRELMAVEEPLDLFGVAEKHVDESEMSFLPLI